MPPRSLNTRSFIFATLIFVVSLMLTGSVWWFTHKYNTQREGLEFTRQVDDTQAAIKQRLEIYTNALRGVGALFASSQSVERDEYQKYFQRINLIDRYPGISAISFMQKVDDAEKEAFIKKVKSDVSLNGKGYPNFTIKPEGVRPEYFVITYIEPTATLESSPTFGLDMKSDPARSAAIEKARDTNSLTATDLLPLVGTSDPTSKGFVLFFPLYKNGMPLDTIEQRREAFLGALNAVFRTDILFTGIFQNATLNPDIDVRIYNGTSENSENLLYESNKDASKSARLMVSHQIPIADRTWSLTFLSSAHFGLDKEQEALPGFVLSVGGTMSVLLFILVYFLLTSQSRAVIYAAKVTKDLQQRTAFQEALLNGADYSIISTDISGVIRTFNKAAERMVGYSASELIGKGTLTILHTPEEVKKRAQELSEEFGHPIEAGFEVFIMHARRGEEEEHEWTYVRKDGSTFPVLLSVSAVKDENGQLIGFMGIASDITDRKEAEEKLKKRTHELEQLNKVMVGRELRMAEIKNELDHLKGEVPKPHF